MYTMLVIYIFLGRVTLEEMRFDTLNACEEARPIVEASARTALSDSPWSNYSFTVTTSCISTGVLQ